MTNPASNTTYVDAAKAAGLITLVGLLAGLAIWVVLGLAMWSSKDENTRMYPAYVFVAVLGVAVFAGGAAFIRHVAVDTSVRTLTAQGDYRLKAAQASKDEAYTTSVMRLNGAQMRSTPQLPSHAPVALKAGNRVLEPDLFRTQAQHKVITNWQAPIRHTVPEAADTAIDDDGLNVPEFVRVERKAKVEAPVESYDERQYRVKQLAVLIYSKCRQRNPSRSYVQTKLGASGAANALIRSNKDVTDAMEELREMGKAWRDAGKTSPWLWVDEATGQPIDLGD